MTEPSAPAEPNSDLGAGLVTAGALLGGYLAKRAIGTRGKAKRADVLVRDAVTRYQAGDVRSGVAGVREAIRLRPDHAVARCLLAWWLGISRTDLAEAVAHAREAARLAPQDTWPHVALAETTFWSGDYGGSWEACRAGLERVQVPAGASTQFYFQFRGGEVLRMTNRPADARALYAAAVRSGEAAGQPFPPYDLGHAYLGWAGCDAALGDWASAAARYRAAVPFRPADQQLRAAITWAEAQATPRPPQPSTWAAPTSMQTALQTQSRASPPGPAPAPVERPARAEPARAEVEDDVEPVRVFVSYSHKDERWLERLKEHLSPYERTGLIAGWDDNDIDAGDEWREEIADALEDADVILVLVSAAFLASNYAYEIELARALERHRDGAAVVVPVILSDANWQATPLGELQAVPKNGRAIKSWSNRERALADAARRIAHAARKGALPAR